MKKIKFITSNKHKVAEIGLILKDYDVELEQVNIDYPENKEDSVEEVAKKAAKNLAEELGDSVIVEDTGIFFNAYNNFPGAHPKFIMDTIGFEGIFRLLEGKDRSFKCETVIAYCEPSGEPILFIGEMTGEVINEVVNLGADTMPYNHILVPAGWKKTVAEMNEEEKASVLQRAKAAHKLGEYLSK